MQAEEALSPYKQQPALDQLAGGSHATRVSDSLLLDNFLTKNKAPVPHKRNSLHRVQILETLQTLRSIKVVPNACSDPDNVKKRPPFSKQDSNSTQSTDKDTSKHNLRPTKPFEHHVKSNVSSLSPVRALES